MGTLWNYIIEKMRFKIPEPEPKPEPEQQKPLCCTYCDGTDFYEGPSGGMSVNILCANRDCRHWFNFAGYVDKVIMFDDLHRVQPLDKFPK